MAVPVMAIVGGREMRDGRVSLRERDGSQAEVPLAEAVTRLQARARPGALLIESLVNRPQAQKPKPAGRWRTPGAARVLGSRPTIAPLRDREPHVRDRIRLRDRDRLGSTACLSSIRRRTAAS